MKNNKQLKILLSPCHSIFDEISEGSEFSWSFNIGDRISKKYPGSVVVTGAATLKEDKPYKIVEVQADKKKRDFGLKNALIFNWRYFLATRKETKDASFDVIHHVLPFGIGRTYNLFWLLKMSTSPRLILGPVQSPLDYKKYKDNSQKAKTAPQALLTSVVGIIPKVLSPVLATLSRNTMKRADKITVINSKTKDMVLEEGIAESKVDVVPPGVDTQKFSFVPYHLKKSDKVELLVVGLLIKRKGIELVIKALAEVVKKHKNVRLTVVGEGPMRNELEKLTKKLHLTKFVHFEGAVPNNKIQEYYKKAHIFINMSRSEGFATVCLEAMSSGLAIISSKVGGFEDAINDGVNGYLVEQESYQQLAEKISKLLKDPKLAERCGHEARKSAETHYDWDTAIIPKYLKLYRKGAI
jgi:glycosyltransferase involved in cell wall biosynthesis